MKKIVRQQNYLKELIDSQDNQLLSKTALRCIIRSCLDPLLDNPEEAVVLYRIINSNGLQGLLKRLEFSQIESYDFSDDGGHLKEKVWANTEFLGVLTHRFVAITIWDNKSDNPNYVRYYTIYNSKMQNEALDIIARNTEVDIKDFQERFKPDRRDNVLMNSSIRRLILNLDEASKDAVLGFAQVQYEKEDANNYENVREIAHEIRNQLSICDLYTEIMKKYCLREGIKDENITNSLKNISKSVKLSGNLLVALKSKEKPTIKTYKLKELVSNAVDLTKVYFDGKKVRCIVENNADIKVSADENKLLASIINIIKNASEAFDNTENDLENGKYIKILTETDENMAVIRISNNAGEIKEPSKIFHEGFTTKEKGSGLGLSISKRNIEEMYGKLVLEHTGDDYTEFTIRLATD